MITKMIMMTVYYIDKNEIPGIFPVTKILYPVKIQFSSFPCEDIKVVMTASVSANYWKLPSQHCACLLFHSQIGRLKNRMEFSKQLPNFDKNIFDNEQNKRIVRRFLPMRDSKVDNLIETEENANTKNKRLVQEIVVLIFHWCRCNKQNITCLLVDTNFNLLMFKLIFHD